MCCFKYAGEREDYQPVPQPGEKVSFMPEKWKKNPLKNNDDFKERFKTTLIADHCRRDIESYKK